MANLNAVGVDLVTGQVRTLLTGDTLTDEAGSASGVDALSDVLTEGNTTGATKIEISNGSGGISSSAGSASAGVEIDVTAGAGDAANAGGAVDINAGTGGSTDGAGGAVTMDGGAGGATNGNGGAISVSGGAAAGSGTDGDVNVGNATTTNVNIASTGAAAVTVGNASAGAVAVDSGAALTVGANATSTALGNASNTTDLKGDKVRVNALPLSSVLSSTAISDAKTVGTTNLYTVPAGQTAVIIGALARPSAAVSITVGATAGVGVAAGEDDIIASQSLTGLLDTADAFHMSNAGGLLQVAAAASVVKFGIDTGATGTSQALVVDLLGYLL